MQLNLPIECVYAFPFDLAGQVPNEVQDKQLTSLSSVLYITVNALQLTISNKPLLQFDSKCASF